MIAQRVAACVAAGLVCAVGSTRVSGAVIGFEEYGLPPASAAPYTGGFTIGAAHFANTFSVWGAYTSWNGFAVSTMTDTSTPGHVNQFSCIAGHGAGGSPAYAVGYDDHWSIGPDMVVTFPDDVQLLSLQVNNTTYAYLSMRDGDAFAKKFGGPSGTDPDWFLLRLRAFDAVNALLGTIDFYLADYRFPDPADDYIVATWTPIDLTAFGSTVRRLEMTLDSSDVGPWGVNTPTYVAVDNLQYIPEPAAAGLAVLGAAAAALLRRRLAAAVAEAVDGAE